MVEEIAKKTKKASFKLQNATTEEKNDALLKIKEALIEEKDKIMEANKIDVEKAKKNNLKSSLIDRLLITEKRFNSMVNGIDVVIELPDPCGEVIEEIRRPNGLLIKKVRVPIGVVGIIYESRPNVTCDATILCLKSGNSVILRGGSEAINSNKTIVSAIRKGISRSVLPEDCVSFIDRPERELVYKMLELDEYIDLIIPRGSEQMIKAIKEKSKIPVIGHGKGLCHLYVDKDADIDMAVRITLNAKVQRPGVCNAIETLLVHESIASEFLPKVQSELEKHNVELRGCEKTRKILTSIKDATEEDWWTEYLDLILSIKIVESVDEAISHINFYGSKHSEAIVTNNNENAKKFLNYVDASTVYHNASTRFTDGGEFGMGAEIGISNQKLHARGPMGLKELTTYKYVVYGNGQIRE
ncbi:MAG: glutamate-5-semialdehyde dehydrogenase [Caldiserica bacterium]|nr:MAG: glutamate-5-semialdehyde dehydrogenase [Caldisericota bacterium]